MASEQDQLAHFASLTGASLNQAQFYLDANSGDLNAAVASYFDGSSSTGNDDAAEISMGGSAHAGSTATGGQGAQSSVGQGAAAAPPAAGAYTLSGAPVDPLPAGWGSAATTSGNSSGRNSGTSTPKNPLRSAGGPRVTGFRDLAAASSSSSGPSGSSGGFGGFGRLGGGGGDDSDDDEGKDPSSFYTGGAKSGLSVENPDDARRRGGVSDMLKNILQQAREGSSRLAGGEEAPAAGPSGSSFFTGSAHTLGSDETPSTYIPDPTGARQSAAGGGAEDEDEEEEEVAVRHLTFWQDGFSIEDGDLMRYDEHRELLAAIQAGRAPISLLKVKHDQPVELRIAERRNEQWTRQPPPPQGPFAGSGNRLGAGSPFPEPTAAPSSSSMPGALPSASAAAAPAGNSARGLVEFEVDRNEPTTQVQIRLRNGERMVATFNHSHTVGDIRQYIDRSRPGEVHQPYVLQTTFPTRELTDSSETIKQAGLLGSVVVQRPT
ncbi:hypothetical protein JCM10908_006996 [Rhodotorula pacifica]|uniref:protein phosphatase regulator SHP1 n=1 Tax=Rhodotorula pacifica TaxID=1495444 RepID=UPI00317C998D